MVTHNAMMLIGGRDQHHFYYNKANATTDIPAEQKILKYMYAITLKFNTLTPFKIIPDINSRFYIVNKIRGLLRDID